MRAGSAAGSVAIWMILLIASAVSILALAAPDVKTTPDRLLCLGPLPEPPRTEGGPSPLIPELQQLPELNPSLGWDVTRLRPAWGRGAPGWRETAVPDGGLALEPGVHWLAARLTLDRFSEVELTVEGAVRSDIFVDGDELKSSSAALSRGTYPILVRVAMDERAPARVRVGAETAEEAGLHWHLAERVPPARYDRFRRVRRISALALAPGGRLIARQARTHPRTRAEDQARSWLDVLDRSGKIVAAHLGGAGAKPLSFSPDGSRLAFVIPGKPHPDLALWDARTGAIERLAENEPQLQRVVWHPSGRGLIVISGRGAADEPASADQAPRRRVHPRDRIPDYRTKPHLHWVDTDTGARRRLTAPGDFVLDDATIGPEGHHVFYARTLPRTEHPWFETEIRQLSLKNGKDTLIDTFRAGWELRPSHLTIAQGGNRLAFVGPPSEIGEGRPAHNVFQTRLYEIDLSTRERRAVPLDTAAAYGYLRAPALRYLPGGSELITTRLKGSSIRLVRIARQQGDRWSVMPLADGSETLERVALAPDTSTAAVVRSSRARPSELWLIDIASGRAEPVETPNADLAAGWLLAEPISLPVDGAKNNPLDAWYYPPTAEIESRRIPLIVYYYGGATPTLRRFTPLHQFLAANGYAVAVVNPRGAAGYSLAFADHHAGDWGPAASADILSAVDRLLESRSEINPAAIGVFGGSYGGFVTNFLITRTDRFAAAVSMYGISDIATYWARGAWGWTYGDMASAGAVPWNDLDLFVKRSPLHLAGRIDTPLLLLHGEADQNVPVGESEQLYTALAVQGKPVELVTFPGESHGISGSFGQRVAHRTMMLEWFDLHLRDQPGAWNHRWSGGDE